MAVEWRGTEIGFPSKARVRQFEGRRGKQGSCRVVLNLGAFGAAHLLAVPVLLPIVGLKLLVNLGTPLDCGRDRAGARFVFPRDGLADVFLPGFVFEALAKLVRLNGAVDRVAHDEYCG